jgi:hypothetical protein
VKRLLVCLLVVAALSGAVVMSRNQSPPATTGDLQVQTEERNPWTHLRLNNDPSEFRFAIVSDRTGGHRARIFSQAVEQLNLLQPEFVLSVGDLVEGYTDKTDRMATEWREFQGYVSKLQMPFFYVPGTHDLANSAMEKVWTEKFGRRHYHFVYRNVLFVILNTEDPPGKAGGIGPEQLNWLKGVLEQNKTVRWTVVALHRPLWVQKNLETSGWLDAEKLLAGRPYTVFAGHEHRFKKFVRQGQNYYQLATTGGGSKLRGLPYGEVDHLGWVTMKKDGPVIANVLLDGIYTEDMKKPLTEELGVSEANRKPVQPVQGVVLQDGCPVPNVQVTFYLVNPDTKKLTRTADSLTEGDGSFALSTYRAGDGAPAGEYVVCIDPRPIYFSDPPRFTPAPVPAKYLSAETSPLKCVVKTGTNRFVFELKP